MVVRMVVRINAIRQECEDISNLRRLSGKEGRNFVDLYGRIEIGWNRSTNGQIDLTRSRKKRFRFRPRMRVAAGDAGDLPFAAFG